MQFLPHFIYYSYLFYLGHLSLLGLQIKTRRQSKSSTFCSWWVLLCMLLASAHKKCLVQKVGHLVSLGLIPMIQAPFNSSCTALQYETGMKFFHWVVLELHGIENHNISVQPCGIFHIFWKVYRVCPKTSRKMTRKRVLFVYRQVCRKETLSSRWKDCFFISSKDLNVGHGKLSWRSVCKASVSA